MPLWVPPAVHQSMQEERDGRFHHLGRKLREIDPRLKLIQWDGDEIEGLKPGWWYIVRHNDDGSPALWEVHHNGEWAEPTEALIDVFRSGDGWVTEPEWRRRREKESRRRDAEKAAREEAARWRLKDAVDYRFRTQIPVSKKVA